MAVYKALGREATGKVAIKIHMGEPGGDNYLKPDMVKDFVVTVNGTFVDCNTAYGGRRVSTAMHLQVAEDHGFTAVAPVDIMDADGEINLPIEGGKHLTQDVVGSHFANYDFVVVLSHFKGHENGWLRRRDQEYVHRHRLKEREMPDPYSRKKQYQHVGRHTG